MYIRKTLMTALLLASAPLAFAQTQLVRGDIDSISGTNRFRLECTSDVELISNTVDLQQLHNQSRQQNIDYEMQVMDASAGGRTILNVVSAVAIPEMLDMGNLRFGRAETWEVFAPSGSPVAVHVNLTANTSYLPLGPAGTWVLSPSSVQLAGGISTNGSLRFIFEMPTIPSLVGVSFSSQAVFIANNAIVITAADCKEVRSN